MPNGYHLVIEKDGGELTIADSISFEHVDFYSGKLTFTPGSKAYIERFRSSLPVTTPNSGNPGGILTEDANRVLTLNDAYIMTRREWKYNGANATLHAGTSTIELYSTLNENFEIVGASHLVYNRFLVTNTNITYGHNSLALFLNTKYFKFHSDDVTQTPNAPIVSLRGVVGDSAKFGKIETNRRLDLYYAAVDSAVFNTIHSTLVMNRSRIKNAYLEGSAAFQELIAIDTLALSYGQYYSFNGSQKYKIFENFRLIGSPCQGPVMFEGSDHRQAYMAEFIKTSGNLDIPYGRIVGIKTSGGAAFNCAGTNENAFGWNFTDYVAVGKDLYWVGGGRYRFWNDPTAWSLTSGGAPANCVPSMYDNVFFDNNSGITGESTNNYLNKRIRIRGGVKPYAKDLNFIGDADKMPAIHLGSRGIDIYGSFVINDGVSFADLNNADTLRFLSSQTGNTITTNGVSSLIRMVFRNPTGEWTLQDSIGLSHNIIFHAGTLNTNDQSMSFMRFVSEGNMPRSLHLGASNIYPKIVNDWGWFYRGTNMVLDAGSSIIHATNNHVASDSTLKYNKIINIGIDYDVILSSITAKYVEVSANPLVPWRRVYIEGVGGIDSLIVHRAADFRGRSTTVNAQLLGHTMFRSSNTFDTITFGDGTTNYFEQNTTQTITSKANSLSTGCNGYSYFTAMRSQNTANIPTATAKIKIPDTETFHINGANMRWMEGVGTGTYSVAGEDLGNNINWVFTPPTTKNLYWVGGSGDWHDKAHWSATSGGAGGYCLPTEYDNVIFDINSNTNPSDSLVVFVANANEAKCHDMTWTGTQGIYKSLYVEQNIYVYGSLDLEADVDYIVRYFRFYANVNFTLQTIKSNGAIIKGMMIFGEVNKETLGSWKLLDKLTLLNTTIRVNNGNITLPGQIRVYGTFDTDGNDIETLMYTGYDRSTTYWRNSTITATYWNAESNAVCGFHGNAITYVDSSHFIIKTNTGQTTQIYLQNKLFNKVTVLNSSFAEVNLHGNFSAKHVEVQSGPYTYTRGSVNIKRLDAYNGLRIVEYATIDTLNVGRGEYYFWPNKTFNIKIFRDSPTACSQSRSVLSAGIPVNITIGESMNLTNTEFQNINALGSGTPYSVTGADLGGNTGLIIGTPTIYNLYLVSDTTIVYWDDNVWALTSGGPASGCIPGRWTNVYVDDNSYIKNPAAVLQLRTGITTVNSKCYDFTSTRSNKFQLYSEKNEERRALWVYGSIDFNSNSEMITEHDGSALHLKAETPQTLKLSYIRGRIYFDGTGSWTLLSDFVVDQAHARIIYFRSGDLKLNGYNLRAAYINEDTKTTNYSIDIKNSTITTTHLIIPTGIIKNPEGSNLMFINWHNGAYFRGNNLYSQFDTVTFDITFGNANSNYNAHGTIETQLKANSLILKSRVTSLVKLMVVDTINIKDFKTVKVSSNSVIDYIVFDKSGTFGAYYSEANKVDMNGDNTFDSIVIAQNGPVYTFGAGTTQTIKNTAFISGSPCRITTFQSAALGQLVNLVLPRPMTVDFMQFAHINAKSYDGTPGTILTAERNSTEMTGSFNQNINFVTAPKTVVGLGPDLTACFKAFPYTISSDGFFAGPSATYEWRKMGSNTIIGTSKDYTINAPGTYWVKVNYDPIYTCIQDDTVSVAKGLPISPVTLYDTLRPVCHKDSMILTVKAPVGIDFKYSLKDTADHTAIVLQSSNIFDNVKAGVYYLVADSLGCYSDSVMVKIREPYRSGLASDIIINDTVVCPGSSIVLSPKTNIGLNPVFKWYNDDALTSEITVGVSSDGRYTTPVLTSPVTYYVTVSSDTICENLTLQAKAVTVGITNANCLNANDDIVYVFECDSVISDITSNDDFYSGYTINTNITGGVPSKGNINLEGEKIKYINTSCVGGETDEYKYSVCSPYLCDTAVVKVSILRLPKIGLFDNCSFKPYMEISINYPSSIHQWQYSADNTSGSWADIPYTGTECTETVPGFYRVKVKYINIETFTKPVELILSRKINMPGNLIWYEMNIIAH